LFAENANLSFLLIPHDTREDFNDATLADMTLARLPAQVLSFSRIVPAPIEAAEIKAIVKDLDIVLSGRMHIAIACLDRDSGRVYRLPRQI